MKRSPQILIRGLESGVQTESWRDWLLTMPRGLSFRGKNNFALGLSTDSAESFQGYHGGHVLIIADEAPGIEPTIWDAFFGIMTGGDVRLIMAGNPTRPSRPFYDAFHNQRGSWNCITIDAFDSPNLAGPILSICWSWIREKVVRSTTILILIWSVSVGCTSVTWNGGTAIRQVRPSGSCGFGHNSPTKMKMRLSN